MEPPKRRSAVCQNVPEVERVVHKQDRRGGLDARRETNDLQKAPAAPFDRPCEWLDDGLFGPQRGRAHRRHGKIAQVAPPLPVLLPPQRSPHFANQNRRKHTNHYGTTDPAGDPPCLRPRQLASISARPCDLAAPRR